MLHIFVHSELAQNVIVLVFTVKYIQALVLD